MITCWRQDQSIMPPDTLYAAWSQLLPSDSSAVTAPPDNLMTFVRMDRTLRDYFKHELFVSYFVKPQAT